MQDYPSGWARALSASADSTAARDLMAFAEVGLGVWDGGPKEEEQAYVLIKS